MFKQSINRIDHIGIIVYPENIDKYIEFFSNVLGVSFDTPVLNKNGSAMMALSWDSGLEIMAPTGKEGIFWERLQRFGEGTTTIIFGVEDIDAALERAKSYGVDKDFEIELRGDEPWLSRFKHFREARLKAFDADFPLSLTLSQIEPADSPQN